MRPRLYWDGGDGTHLTMQMTFDACNREPRAQIYDGVGDLPGGTNPGEHSERTQWR